MGDIPEESDDPAEEMFVGDLFVELAEQGRLVVDPGLAARLIDELEQTLAIVGERQQRVELARRNPPGTALEWAPGQQALVVDALFVEQVAPGRMERALVELPKYLEALRIARDRAFGQER